MKPPFDAKRPTHAKPSVISPLALCVAAAFVLTACDGQGELDPVFVEPEMISVEPSLSTERAAVPTRPEPPARGPSPTRPRAGVVTAGDIDDALNLDSFAHYAARTAKKTGLPGGLLGRPLLARLVGEHGAPLPGTRVTLRRKGQTEPFYDGYSGVNGLITVFPKVHGATSGGTFELTAFPRDQREPVRAMLTTKDERLTVKLPDAEPGRPQFLDIIFVIDTTGSMGDELDWLKKELRTLVRRVERQTGGVDIRYGFVAYRDKGDDYVTRILGLTSNQSRALRWLRKQNANGGGDYPEAADKGLDAGAAQAWRRGNGKRILFHIADAPPHSRDVAAYFGAVSKAAKKNVQIFGLGASGVAAESEYLMRQAALATGGRYIFLTDDSGVGNAHAEPNISCYRVTALKSLLQRILVSELTGLRQEAASSEVIREVGTYQNGVCGN